MASQRTALAGLVAGVLAIPLVAFAATALLAADANTETAEPAVAAAPPLGPTGSEPVPSATPGAAPSGTSTTTSPSGASTGTDLENACGDDGLSLVAAERAGTASDVQQAALDALRPICDEAGTPLPAAPSEAVVVVEAAPLTPAGAVATTSADFDDDDDGAHRRRGHDDDDDRDDDDRDDDDRDDD